VAASVLDRKLRERLVAIATDKAPALEIPAAISAEAASEAAVSE